MLGIVLSLFHAIVCSHFKTDGIISEFRLVHFRASNTSDFIQENSPLIDIAMLEEGGYHRKGVLDSRVRRIGVTQLDAPQLSDLVNTDEASDEELSRNDVENVFFSVVKRRVSSIVNQLKFRKRSSENDHQLVVNVQEEVGSKWPERNQVHRESGDAMSPSEVTAFDHGVPERRFVSGPPLARSSCTESPSVNEYRTNAVTSTLADGVVKSSLRVSRVSDKQRPERYSCSHVRFLEDHRLTSRKNRVNRSQDEIPNRIATSAPVGIFPVYACWKLEVLIRRGQYKISCFADYKLKLLHLQ